MLRLDHVVYGVPDLAAAAARIEAEVGLRAVSGGRHPGKGTENLIIPLGRASYLELLTAIDPGEARGFAFGRAILAAMAGPGRLLAWSVATDDVAGVAARLGTPLGQGARQRPDGVMLRWRSTGTDRALAEPSLPFFIQWEVADALHPGHDRSPPQASGIAWLGVSGDAAALDAWLGPHQLPLRVEPGRPGVTAVGIATADGERAFRL